MRMVDFMNKLMSFEEFRETDLFKVFLRYLKNRDFNYLDGFITGLFLAAEINIYCYKTLDNYISAKKWIKKGWATNVNDYYKDVLA